MTETTEKPSANKSKSRRRAPADSNLPVLEKLAELGAAIEEQRGALDARIRTSRNKWRVAE